MRCTTTIQDAFKDHDHDEITSRWWTLKPGGVCKAAEDGPASAPAAPRGRYRRALGAIFLRGRHRLALGAIFFRGRHRRALGAIFFCACADRRRRAQPPHHPPRHRPRGGRVGVGPASGPERRRAGAERRPRAPLPTRALLALVQKELLRPNGRTRLFAGAGPGAALSTAQRRRAGLAGVRTCTRLCPRRRRPTPSARGAAPEGRGVSD
jgi:hypothetical protein